MATVMDGGESSLNLHFEGSRKTAFFIALILWIELQELVFQKDHAHIGLAGGSYFVTMTTPAVQRIERVDVVK